MSRWEDVLETQHEQWAWWRTDIGRRFGEAYTKDKDDSGSAPQSWVLSHVAQAQELQMWHAEPIAIEPEMWTLIEAAQLSFQPEPLREEDIITPAGFTILPKPIHSLDVWNKTVTYRALGWMPSFKQPPIPESPALETAARMLGWGDWHGIWLSIYTDIRDPDHYNTELLAHYNETPEQMMARTAFPPLTLAHVAWWEFGHDYNNQKWEEYNNAEYYRGKGVNPDEALANFAATLRNVHALFRLLNQTITVHTTRRAPRATRHRARRIEYPDKEITVVTLRRPRHDAFPDNNGESHAEWTKRWLVSGHWRRQWYPSVNEHKQIWISPYIKGPDDMPLVIRQKRVFKFGR